LTLNNSRARVYLCARRPLNTRVTCHK
jgi:hypothetical protein